MKIGIVSPNLFFFDPILKELVKKYEVKIFTKTEHPNPRITKFSDRYIDNSFLYIDEFINWADVVFFEWCSVECMNVTNRIEKAEGKYYICRIHSREFFNGLVAQTDFNKIDKVICVSNAASELFKRLHKNVEYEHIITGIDLNSFIDLNQKRDGICFVGDLNYIKGHMNLLNLFKLLLKFDSSLTLNILGNYGDLRDFIFVKNFCSNNNLNINFYSPYSYEKMSLFYNKYKYILSTSLFEGQHTSLMEAMSCGTIPIIYNWLGADSIYPKQYLFNNLDEAIKIFEMCESNWKTNSEYCKQYAQNNFDEIEKTKQVLKIIDNIKEV